MLRVHFFLYADKGQRSINRWMSVPYSLTMAALLLFGTRKVFHFFTEFKHLVPKHKIGNLRANTLKVHTDAKSFLFYVLCIWPANLSTVRLCAWHKSDRFIGPLIICILDLDQQLKTGNCCLWVNILSNIVNVRLLQIYSLDCVDTFIDSNWAELYYHTHRFHLSRLRWKNCRAKYASVTAHRAAAPSKRVGEWRRTLIRKLFVSFDAPKSKQVLSCTNRQVMSTLFEHSHCSASPRNSRNFIRRPFPCPKNAANEMPTPLSCRATIRQLCATHLQWRAQCKWCTLTSRTITAKRMPKKAQLARRDGEYKLLCLQLNLTGPTSECDPNGTGSGSCSELCCGRGFDKRSERRVNTQHNCRYVWCCRVECETITEVITKFVCRWNFI